MAALLTLVALNTLLFLGLSVAKFAPWPDPVHPRTLRPAARGEAAPPPPCARQRVLLRLTAAMARFR
jgi:hypothetical protein